MTTEQEKIFAAWFEASRFAWVGRYATYQMMESAWLAACQSMQAEIDEKKNKSIHNLKLILNKVAAYGASRDKLIEQLEAELERVRSDAKYLLAIAESFEDMYDDEEDLDEIVKIQKRVREWQSQDKRKTNDNTK